MNHFHFLNSRFRLRVTVYFLSVFILASLRGSAQHAHIYSGVRTQNTGEPLVFVNGNLWDTNSYGGHSGSPACIYFADNLPENYPGLYQTTATFSALAATVFNAGPSPFAAALGSYIELGFVSLQGPPGGSLSVWSEIDDPSQPALLFTVPVGTSAGTNRFNLSEGDPADPSSDPYGHIHGRRFALNKPGLYTLGLQLMDTSKNGLGGGPIHMPSEVTHFYLQAGLFLSNFSVTDKVARARFGLPGSKDYVFEASSVLPATNWVTITNVLGTAHSELQWVADPEATTANRFYRIREASE